MFFSYLENNNIYCLDFENGDSPSSKKAADVLVKAGIRDKKPLLFLGFDDESTFASFRNLSKVQVVSFDQPNVFDISRCGCWVFLKKDLEQFKDMVSKWI